MIHAQSVFACRYAVQALDCDGLLIVLRRSVMYMF